MCINIIYAGFPGLGFQVKNLCVMFVFAIVSFLFFSEYKFAVDIVQGQNLQEYVMNSTMISILMGCADVILGIQWLQSLGTVDFNFQEIFMKFSLEGK